MRPPSRRQSQVYIDLPVSTLRNPLADHATTASKENGTPGMARNPSFLSQPDSPAVSSTTTASKRKRTLSETQIPQSIPLAVSAAPYTNKKAKAMNTEQDEAMNRDSTALKGRKSNPRLSKDASGSRKSKSKSTRAVTTDGKGKDLDASNANEEYPNGFFYCHQCAKKRDATSSSPRMYALGTILKCSRKQ
jgi:hypothetical protein